MATGLHCYERRLTHGENRKITRYGTLRSQGRRQGLRPFVKTPRQNALLRVQPVFGFIEHDRLRSVDHFVGDLLAAMGGQAVHCLLYTSDAADE